MLYVFDTYLRTLPSDYPAILKILSLMLFKLFNLLYITLSRNGERSTICYYLSVLFATLIKMLTAPGRNQSVRDCNTINCHEIIYLSFPF